MLSGRQVEFGGSRVVYLAIDAEAAAGNGVWIYVGDYKRRNVKVKGMSGATTVIISESGVDADTNPLATDHGDVIDTLTADGSAVWTSVAGWIKVRISVWAAGTITAHLTAAK